MNQTWTLPEILSAIAIAVTIILAIIGGIWKLSQHFSTKRKNSKDESYDNQPILDISLKKENIQINGFVHKAKHSNGEISIPELKLTSPIEIFNKGKDIARLYFILSGNKYTGSDYLRESFKNKIHFHIKTSSSFFNKIEVMPGDKITFKFNCPIHFMENSNDGVLHLLFFYQNSNGNLYDFYYWIKFPDMPVFFKQSGFEGVPFIDLKKNKNEWFKNDEKSNGESKMLSYPTEIIANLSDTEENKSWERYSNKELAKIQRIIKNQDKKRIKDEKKAKEALLKHLKRNGIKNAKNETPKIFILSSISDIFNDPELRKKISPDEE